MISLRERSPSHVILRQLSISQRICFRFMANKYLYPWINFDCGTFSRNSVHQKGLIFRVRFDLAMISFVSCDIIRVKFPSIHNVRYPRSGDILQVLTSLVYWRKKRYNFGGITFLNSRWKGIYSTDQSKVKRFQFERSTTQFSRFVIFSLTT